MLKKLSFFIKLVCIFSFTSLIILSPFIMSKNLYTGIDMGFHLNRAYDLAENLKNGNIFPFITTYSFNHLGTQINMAYGLLPVYPLAIGLILFKNPVIGIYFGIGLIQVISALLSYYCSLKYFKNYQKAFFFALIYIYSIFNFSFMIGSFSFGEISATAFLPLIVYGTYSILYGKNEWWYLAMGMSLTFYSHLLSVLIYSSFVLVILILSVINNNFTVQKFKSFLYAIISTILMSSFYMVNFFTMLSDQKMSSTMVVNTTANEMKLSNIIIQSLDNELFGTIFILIIIVALINWNKLSNNSKIIFILGSFFTCFVTPFFDFFWKIIDKTPLKMIQFPYRFLVLSTFCFTIVIVDVTTTLINRSNTSKVQLFKSSILICGLLLAALSWSTTFVRTKSNNVALTKPTLSSQLPFNNYKVDATTFKYLTNYYYNGVGDTDYWPVKSIKSSYQKDKLKHNFAYSGNKEILTHPIASSNKVTYILKTNNSGNLDLPFFYSKNLKVLVNGKQYTYENSNRGTVKLVTLPKGLHTIRILYQPTIISRIAALLSIITFIYLINCILLHKKIGENHCKEKGNLEF